MLGAIRRFLDSGAGTVVGCIGCLTGWGLALYADKSLWPFVVGFIGLLLLFLVLTYGRFNIPLSGPRFLPEDQTRKFIDYAFESVHYPVCRAIAASHAGGAVGAGVATRNIAGELRRFSGLASSAVDELSRETDNSAFQLEFHRTKVARFCAMVDSLAILWRATKLVDVPGGQSVLDDLLKTGRFLEIHVLGEVERTFKRIPKGVGWQDQHKPWNRDVQQLLHVNMHDDLRLLAAPDWLPSMIREAEAILDRLKQDWNSDVMQTQGRAQCRPES